MVIAPPLLLQLLLLLPPLLQPLLLYLHLTSWVKPVPLLLPRQLLLLLLPTSHFTSCCRR